MANTYSCTQSFADESTSMDNKPISLLQYRVTQNLASYSTGRTLAAVGDVWEATVSSSPLRKCSCGVSTNVSDPQHLSSHYRDESKINWDLALGCIIEINTSLITSPLPDTWFLFVEKEQRGGILRISEREKEVSSLRVPHWRHNIEERVTDHLLISLKRKSSSSPDV